MPKFQWEGTTRAGERNTRLYNAAFRLGTMLARGWLGDSEIRCALHGACQANGLIKDDGAPAFQRTLESGLRDGLKVPHQDLKDREQYVRHAGRAGKPEGDTPDDDEPRGRLKQHRATGSWEEPDSSILDDRRGELPNLPAAAISSAFATVGSCRSTSTANHFAVLWSLIACSPMRCERERPAKGRSNGSRGPLPSTTTMKRFVFSAIAKRPSAASARLPSTSIRASRRIV